MKQKTQMPTYGSLTACLKAAGIKATAKKVNIILERAGLIKKRFRVSTKKKEEVRSYWEILDPDVGINTRPTRKTPHNATTPIFYGERLWETLAKAGIKLRWKR